jgi:pimeloyl-ACP methyl ester carboxylesterase
MNTKGNYAQVNGLELYYAIHGEGEPLILLHGGLGATEMFGDVSPLLAKGHQVIAVDLQAHGRTADIDRPLSFEAMADDIAALIKHLELQQAAVMGYSNGGSVALRTAIQHPELVQKLIVVSAPFKRDGWYPEVQTSMAQMSAELAEPMKPTPMYQLYSSIAPRVEDWPVLLAKTGDMMRRDYDWSKEVATLETPTMIVVVDADSVRTSHAVEFFELLGGGQKDGGWDGSGISKAQLAILPRLTHYNIFNSPALATTVIPFLEAPAPNTH